MTDLELIKQFKEACLTGDMELVKKSIAQGVDYTNDNNYGLSVAAATGRVDVIKFLLETTDLKFDYQNNLLFRLSCRHQNINVIDFLIDYSQKINNPIDYTTSFLQVCEEENEKVLKHLLKHAKIKPRSLHEGFIQIFIRANKEMFEEILYSTQFKLTEKIKIKLQNIYNEDNSQHERLNPLMSSVTKYELNKNLNNELEMKKNNTQKIKI